MSTSRRSGSARFWLLLIGALVVFALVVGGGGSDGPPLDPRSVNPDGTRGLVEVLEDLGASVRLDDSIPDPDVSHALILRDRLTESDANAVGRWVDRGGILVVADPSSRFAAQPVGFAGPTVAVESCSIGALKGVLSVTGGGRTYAPGGGDQCFGSFSRSYVVAQDRGDGTIVSIGGPTLFTNEVLDERDNAFVAVTLLAPRPDGATISFVAPSTIDFGDQSLDELVPTRLTNAIVQLLAAFVLYALFRMRRLGRVVQEPLPVRIRGSELVLQAGVLSERAEDPAGAAEVIRSDFVDRWRQVLALSATDRSEVATQVAGVTGGDADTLRSALEAPIATDSDLVELVRRLDEADRTHRAQLITAKGRP